VPTTTIGCTYPHEEEGADSLENMPWHRGRHILTKCFHWACSTGTVCAFVTQRGSENVLSLIAPLASTTTIGCTCSHEEEGANSLENTPRRRVMFCNMLRQHFSFFTLFIYYFDFLWNNAQYMTILEYVDNKSRILLSFY